MKIDLYDTWIFHTNEQGKRITLGMIIVQRGKNIEKLFRRIKEVEKEISIKCGKVGHSLVHFSQGCRIYR